MRYNYEHMPRIKQHRKVCCNPNITIYKPAGIKCNMLQSVELTLDEIEALRLADMEGLYHADAALQMQISRQTFGRIVSDARKKVATAIINGYTIRIANRNNSDAQTPSTTEAQANTANSEEPES